MNIHRFRVHTHLLAGAATLLVLSDASMAQSPAESTKTAALEEIVVTANRREESLQEVSASVTAFSAADIEHKGFDGFADFAGSVPGLTLNEAVKNRAMFNIRGVSLSVNGDNSQDPVAIYINDTPVTDTFAAVVAPDLRLFDVERIEVLRGPQGTLFGSGSLGGAVRIITHQPDATRFESAGRVDFGHTKGGGMRQRYDGMLNVPLIEDKLALRGVAYYRDEEGWVRNANLGTRNDTKDWGGRASLLWKPTDELLVKAEIIHQESDPEDSDAWNPAVGKYTKASSIAEGRKTELNNYSMTVAYDFADFATLSSITTQQKSESSYLIDSGDLFGLGLPLVNRSSPWETEFLVQELRLVSNTKSRLEWVVGAFYIDREANIPYLNDIIGLDDLFGGAIGRDAFFDSPIDITSEEVALYGDVTFHITDALRVNAGLRGFRIKAGYAELDRKVLDFDTLTYVTTSFSNHSSDSDFTWRAGLSYDVTDTAMLYANVAKGFRVGQVNPNNGPSQVDPNDYVIPEGYGPDTTINYELGAKTAWLDGRLIANLAVYRIDWSDIQIDGLRISDRRAFVANAGEARSQGVELELSARPTQALTLYAAVTFQDAEITEVPTVILVPAAKGDVLPGLVDLKYSAGFEYRWDIASAEWYVRADGQHVESSPNALSGGGTNASFAINQAYDNVDAAIGLTKRWGEISLYGENLTNNDSYILNSGPTALNPINTLRPRTFGARVTVRY